MTGAAKVSTSPVCLVQHVNAKATVRAAACPSFLRGDQIDREMVFENLDVRLRGDRRQQRAFDLAAGHVFGVQNPALGMAAFLAQIQFACAVDADLALGKLHAQLDQLRDARRAFLDDRAHDLLLAQARARLRACRARAFRRNLPCS